MHISKQHSIAKQLSNVQTKALGISSNKPALPHIVTVQRAVGGLSAGLRVTPPTVKSGPCHSLVYMVLRAGVTVQVAPAALGTFK